MNKSKEAGYTLTELVVVLGLAAAACVAGLVIYTIVHFIIKLW